MRGFFFIAIVLTFAAASQAQISLDEAQERLRQREAIRLASTRPATVPSVIPGANPSADTTPDQTLTQLAGLAEIHFRRIYVPPPPPVRNATAVQQQNVLDAIQKSKDELDYQFRTIEQQQTIAVILVSNVVRKNSTPALFVVQGNLASSCSSYAAQTNLGLLSTFAPPTYPDSLYAKLHTTAAQHADDAAKSKFNKDQKKWQSRHDSDWFSDIEIQTADPSVQNWSVGDIYCIRVNVNRVNAQLQTDNRIKLTVSATEILPEVAGASGN